MLYFLADNGTGVKIFKYNGTGTPTVAIASITYPSRMTLFNGKFYFSYYTSTKGGELWSYDGASAANIVADINPGLNSSNPRDMLVVNNKLYFTAQTANNGSEIMSYDGINPPVLEPESIAGPNTIYPNGLTKFKNSIIFEGCDATYGCEPWILDK